MVAKRATCSICHRENVGLNIARQRPGLVCADCDGRAVNAHGRPARFVSSDDTGDNPVYVDGVKCWRRYHRGYETMRDDTPCATLDEFLGIAKTGDLARNVIPAAQAALASDGVRIHGGLGLGKPPLRSRYRGARFDLDGRRWVACQTKLVKTNAQLLDATIAYKEAHGAERAVAILQPPAGVDAGNGVAGDYALAHRAAAWHGFGIVWVAADRLQDGWVVDPVRPPTYSQWLDDLVHDFRERITLLLDVESLRSSRTAELPVRAPFEGVLVERGFERASASYKTFWRSAKSAGFWSRFGAGPNTIALEVKGEEDTSAPFSQVVESLGRADAVVQVRLAKRSTQKELDKLGRAHLWLPALKARVESRLPVRFIEI